ncbi:flagellar hook-basal body protein [Clostridium sp. C105KSO13]|uniref:flagellar hook-basal body protein n=1 Tax=Clostridium sp. C105KSO13 TaxID=1776045 RepID=UPI000740772E|nr:flagellar hook-basal body complex protein [Clostridium sp. C105KSO13]CUX49264.1 Flagellar basal-body rod protein FlgG [Clostridium sp. C105KSO13]
MVKSMYAAIAGLRSHQNKMDVISNNIANVNTWGFKSRTANFQDAMYQNLTNSTGGNTTEGGNGGINSSQLGYGVNMGSISTNFTTGSWGYTGNSMNCMIDGTGFFIVGPMQESVPADALAENNMNLSRVGIFSVDNNGYLVDNDGNYIYGFTEQAADGTWNTENLQPIRIPTDDAGERYNISSYKIGADGVITGITKDSQKITIGQIAVATVENPGGLEQTAGYLYTIGENAGNVLGVQTMGTTTGTILSGYLEMSNVDLATEMSNMITTQRGYQANTKVITVTDEMLEQLVNMKR